MWRINEYLRIHEFANSLLFVDSIIKKPSRSFSVQNKLEQNRTWTVLQNRIWVNKSYVVVNLNGLIGSLPISGLVQICTIRFLNPQVRIQLLAKGLEI